MIVNMILYIISKQLIGIVSFLRPRSSQAKDLISFQTVIQLQVTQPIICPTMKAYHLHSIRPYLVIMQHSAFTKSNTLTVQTRKCVLSRNHAFKQCYSLQGHDQRCILRAHLAGLLWYIQQTHQLENTFFLVMALWENMFMKYVMNRFDTTLGTVLLRWYASLT